MFLVGYYGFWGVEKEGLSRFFSRISSDFSRVSNVFSRILF